MLLALDESGKDGIKPIPGQSPWLVIGGVLFPTRAAADTCAESLQRLRVQLGGGEFRFSKTNDVRRRRVLECLAGHDFSFHAAVCDRRVLCDRRWRRKSPLDLYLSVGGSLAAALAPQLLRCDVVFDTLGGEPTDRRYAQLWTKLAGAASGGEKRVRSCTSTESHKDASVQAADYICGAIARSLHPDKSDPSYLWVIRRRQGLLVTWIEPATKRIPVNEEGEPLSPPAPPV